MTINKGVLTANSAHSITIGNIRVDRAIVIHYTGKRSGLVQYGKLVIMNKMSTADVAQDFSGDDIGVIPTAVVSDNDIILTLTADNSDAYDIEYIVDIENIKL
jgi:hypothetical protein